ncbi:MAG TPA: ECF-type sigma factor [Longimicrobiales bacterium]|nr:ECF-type sigma factor [Longimicrobiales bacterium]
MAYSAEAELTHLLGAIERGDGAALHALFPLLYEELRGLARRERRRLPGNATLNTTALVHEAYLKLVDRPWASWDGRVHFMATAAKAMRQILIDYARRQQRQKRGGRTTPVSLHDLDGSVAGDLAAAQNPALLLAFDEALREIERVNPRQSRIVECRIFGGMTVAETAAALGISTASVSRAWAVARARLYAAIAGEA